MQICNKARRIFIDPVTNSIRKLLSSYARIFNNQTHRSGSIFRQKTKSKCLSDVSLRPESTFRIQDYYVNCFHYIHQNPLAAKLVTRLEDWEFSSFRDYAGLREGKLCQKDLASLHCDYNAESFIEKSYSQVDKKIMDYFK